MTMAFLSREARELTGATQRQLDYWDSIDLVRASVCGSPGKGRARSYSFSDLLKLQVVVSLRRAGVTLQRIRKALKVLDGYSGKDGTWAGKKIVVAGDDILVTTSDRAVLKSLSQPGQLAFSVVLIGDVVQDARQRISIYQTKRKKAAS